MNFDFSDDEQQLSDAVRKWVDRGYGFERRRAIEKSGGFSAQAWSEIAELGLLGLGTSEDDGGMALGPVAAMLALEALGRGLVLEPVAAVALVAAAVLARAPADVRAAWAPALASGDRRVVLAYQERAARYRLERVDTRAAQAGGAWTVSGAKSLVPIGDQADAFIVPARVGGTADDPAGIALLLVERTAAGVATRGYALQDGSRAAEVAFDAAPATLLVPAGQGFAALEHAIDVGVAALAAEGVGVMDRLFELTVDYLNTRKQFGVPIGTFQALRHRIADMKMQLELARSMSYFATLKLAEEPAARRRAIAQAKVQLGNSARFLGQQAIQLHGGIGMTDEYVGSHYFKRLTTMEMQFGDTMHHLGEVSARMQETAGVFVG
ncbi:MAG: acyl-CoA dehydrogenase family protein [Burkholderiaceae bacterium]